MSHMAEKNHDCHKPVIKTVLLAGSAICLWLAAATCSKAMMEDRRQMVKMPEMMKTHMLANMRDHLRAIDEILQALSENDFEKAGNIAENRLGVSSMSRHGAAHMAPFMPKSMAAIGTGMHRAASRFAITAANAELEPASEGARKVYAALHEITANCNACHSAFRLR